MDKWIDPNTFPIRQITEEEFMALKPGDKVYVKYLPLSGDDASFMEQVVEESVFYHGDHEAFEIGTDKVFCEMGSLYLPQN